MKPSRKKTNPTFPIQPDMSEHGMSYCLIKNQEARTPWGGDDDTFGVMRWATIDHIVDLRAHGLHERDVITKARRYVADWFSTGAAPKPFGNPAVRALARIQDTYPIIGETVFCSFLYAFAMCDNGKTALGYIRKAMRDKLIFTRPGRYGIEYRLAHEPQTRAVCDLLERVAAMMPRHPLGVPLDELYYRKNCIYDFSKSKCGALVERALNAGVIRKSIEENPRFVVNPKFIITKKEAK